MADDTDWDGEDLGVAAVGVVVAECGACRTRTALPRTSIVKSGSRVRLEAALRCSCGGRGGRLHWGGELQATRDAPARCYLFHA